MLERRVMVAALAVGAMAVGATPASGHVVKNSASVTIDHEVSPETRFFGEITSKAKRCIKNRTVNVFQRSNDTLWASGTSDSEGNWSAPYPPPAPNDSYYAKVEKSKKGSGNHKHICKAATSEQDVVIDESCQNVVLLGDANDGKLSVDDDLEVFVNDVSVFIDDDEFAQDLDPVALGPLTAGDSIRVVASNSTDFGFGPVQIDPLRIRCQRTDGLTLTTTLDFSGFSGNAAAGAVFYDQTFTMPDFFD
jgi:hypothetical protein